VSKIEDVYPQLKETGRDLFQPPSKLISASLQSDSDEELNADIPVEEGGLQFV